MIILTQIKAARALLGWTQDDLAKAAKLSLPAINNIERGLTTPRKETLQSIQSTLSDAGIDFIDQIGVQLRPPELEIQILEGADWLKKYDDIVISTLKSPEDEICQFSCDEKLWMIYGGTTNHHYIIHRNKTGFQERILIPQSQKFFTNLRKVYRTASDDLFRQTSWQVFGSYVAQIIWAKRQILLTRSTTLADAQRAIFDALWDNGKPLTEAQWKKLEKWDSPDSVV